MRQAPSIQASNALTGTTTFQSTQPPEEKEKANQSWESKDEVDNKEEKEEEKNYFDAEAVTEQDLGSKSGEVSVVCYFYWQNSFFGQVSILRAKIISGLSIAGKTVQVKKLPNGMFNHFFLIRYIRLK